MTMSGVIELMLEKQQGVWASLVFEELAWFQGEVRRLYGRGREVRREGREKGRQYEPSFVMCNIFSVTHIYTSLPPSL